MLNRFRLFALLSIMTLLLSWPFSPPVLANHSPAGSVDLKPGKVLMKEVSLEEQAAASGMWTREAVASPQPMEMPTAARLTRLTQTKPVQSVTGPAGSIAPQMAEPDADQVAREAYPQDWAALAETAGDIEPEDPAGAAGVFESYIVNNSTALWKTYPYKWIGRLTFTTPSGARYCSATAISGNVVLTAGHCLYDTFSAPNQWYSNWVFTPAYRAGSMAPYGMFTATGCYILSNYMDAVAPYEINTHAPWDVGVCKVRANSAGQTLNGAVGSMGLRWNVPAYSRLHHILGYPYTDTNTNLLSSPGYYLRACVSEGFQQGTETKGAGCNLGKGMSGGPWMTGYKPNVMSGYVESVSSALILSQPNLYGPRFNDYNIVPLCELAGC